MKYIATFDIGTTAVKGVLVGLDDSIAASEIRPIPTIFEASSVEQDPEIWYQEFCSISKAFLQTVPANDILGIIASGQMQDLIPIQANGKPARNAILYSDGRANAQAEKIKNLFSVKSIRETTGNNMDGSIPFAKLIWLAEQEKDCFQRTARILFSAKDYVLHQLTGASISDATTCATVGLMDITTKQWRQDWINAMGIPNTVMPKLSRAEEMIGTVTTKAMKETGYQEGTPVFAGSGDAGAATLAGGIIHEGDYNINLGTTGWISTISNSPTRNESVFNLAAIPPQTYINVVPFFNAGNVHQWICTILGKKQRTVDYATVHQLLSKSQAGSHGVYFLPYLVGERFPVMDQNIRGAFTGLSATTTKKDLVRAALEGVAFSIRQGLEAIGIKPQFISIVGGGTKEPIWMQIFADILNFPVNVITNGEFFPAIVLASAAKIGMGLLQDYREIENHLRKNTETKTYTPIVKNAALYEKSYHNYLKIYPMMRMR